ncbi:SDR family oxidoreductase [Bradyrhizobium xenonodulans]|uniref:SDR family oxidoreductase n=1 Tax=Bradyrhizobium xenonodulans TaxID=2736875 RepID=A0ABY7MJV6_9BRAD|nr:SDR family oxidoreductase [Bradyrhizobium xenonodulans]WBL77859.1 SDR family oxidoreductase [Bradyrhizobium xenonodulans]
MAEYDLCAIVTGSASGLGAASARLLAADGARLVINYSSNRKDAEATAEACRNAGAAEVLVVQGDVSRDQDCNRIVAAAASWGKLDVLINNAGITKHVPHHTLEGLSADDFQQIYAVNTIGPYQMIRAARSLLEANVQACGVTAAVVNISSVAGINGDGSSLAYVASKGALNVMTLSLAKALAPAIRVNTVCPGYIDTSWYAKGCGEARAKEVRDAITEKAALKIVSSAMDIAHLVHFLASSASSHMTGECVRMDAGLHLVR